MAQIYLPNAITQLIDNSKLSIYADGANVEETLINLFEEYPSIRKQIFSSTGNLLETISVFLDNTNIEHLEGVQTKTYTESQIVIVKKTKNTEEKNHQNIYLSKEEVMRYSRHLIMPEVAVLGQKKLKSSSVLIIGLGGLGSPVGLYLAAAGIGRLGVVDFDIVDLTNLQRQVMYGTKDIGHSKLEVTKQRLTDLNPKIEIDTYQSGITTENALRIFQNYDVIVDGTDNFATRYLVNDACVMLGKPNVFGSIFRFDGQASVFFAEKGPCYRCVYPEPPPPEFVPSCAEGGVLGILPATIGSIQATEAIKLILGKGDSLIGRLLVFDALKMRFKELKLHKNANCAICSKNPTIKGLIDYKEFCGVPSQDTRSNNQPNLVVGDYEITPQQLKEKLDSNQDILVLDVRELTEYQICNLPKSTLIPIGELPFKLTQLDKNKEIVVYCKLGIRTSRAIHLLRDSGFNKAKGLIGGINLWAQKIDTDMPRY